MFDAGTENYQNSCGQNICLRQSPPKIPLLFVRKTNIVCTTLEINFDRSQLLLSVVFATFFNRLCSGKSEADYLDISTFSDGNAFLSTNHL